MINQHCFVVVLLISLLILPQGLSAESHVFGKINDAYDKGQNSEITYYKDTSVLGVQKLSFYHDSVDSHFRYSLKKRLPLLLEFEPINFSMPDGKILINDARGRSIIECSFMNNSIEGSVIFNRLSNRIESTCYRNKVQRAEAFDARTGTSIELIDYPTFTRFTPRTGDSILIEALPDVVMNKEYDRSKHSGTSCATLYVSMNELYVSTMVNGELHLQRLYNNTWKPYTQEDASQILSRGYIAIPNHVLPAFSGTIGVIKDASGIYSSVLALSYSQFAFDHWQSDSFVSTMNPLPISYCKTYYPLTAVYRSFSEGREIPLVVEPRNSGTIVLSGSSSIISHGEQSFIRIPSTLNLTLTAVPTPGLIFTGWRGAFSGTINPLIVYAQQDVSSSIIAEFSPLSKIVVDTSAAAPPVVPSLELSLKSVKRSNDVILIQDASHIYCIYKIENSLFISEKNGSTWSAPSRLPFSISTNDSSFSCVMSNNSLFIVYSDMKAAGKLSLKRFNNKTWESVGKPGFTSGPVSRVVLSISKKGTPYCAYMLPIDHGAQLRVDYFDGSQWLPASTLPLSFSQHIIHHFSFGLDESGTPFLAFRNIFNKDRASVISGKNNKWFSVGPEVLSSRRISGIALNWYKGMPLVMYRHEGWKPVALSFKGSSWEPLDKNGIDGALIDAQDDHPLTLCVDKDIPYIIYKDTSTSGSVIKLRYFYGGKWISWVKDIECNKDPGFTSAVILDGRIYIAVQGVSGTNALIYSFPLPTILND